MNRIPAECTMDVSHILDEVNAERLAALPRQQRRTLAREAQGKGRAWLTRRLSLMQARGQLRLGRAS